RSGASFPRSPSDAGRLASGPHGVSFSRKVNARRSWEVEGIKPSMNSMNRVRSWLRSWPEWVYFRRLQRIGWMHNLHRWRIVPRILKTRPIHTQPVGDQARRPCEVHLLTWDGDWQFALWAAKSFYYYADVDWPLVWHEGGSLRPAYRAVLKRHFP